MSAKKRPAMEAASQLESESLAKELTERKAASRLESERSAKELLEKETARKALLDSLSRRGLLRSPGSILVNLDNCDEIRTTIDFDRLLRISG